MASFTWHGGTSGDVSVAGNYVENAVPQTGDSVYVGSAGFSNAPTSKTNTADWFFTGYGSGTTTVGGTYSGTMTLSGVTLGGNGIPYVQQSGTLHCVSDCDLGFSVLGCAMQFDAAVSASQSLCAAGLIAAAADVRSGTPRYLTGDLGTLVASGGFLKSTSLFTRQGFPMAQFNIQIQAGIGGVSCAGQINEQAGGQLGEQFSVAPAQAGSLTTHTSTTAGVFTSTSALSGVTTSTKPDLYWAGGMRYGVTVSNVSGNAVTFSGGAGSDLPIATTAMTIAVPTSGSMEFIGTNVQLAAISSNTATSVLFQNAASGTVCQVSVAAGQCWLWAESQGSTNPFLPATGLPVTVLVSNGDAVNTASVNIGVAFNQ